MLAALALSSAIAAGAGTTDVLTCAAEINKALLSRESVGRRFDITAKLIWPSDSLSDTVVARDATGSVKLHDARLPPSAVGGTFRFIGDINAMREGTLFLRTSASTMLSPGKADPPRSATLAQVISGDFALQVVKVSGTVVDACLDDVDRRFAFFMVYDGRDMAFATKCLANEQDDVKRFVGAKVSITGICSSDSPRAQTGWNVSCGEFGSISVISPPPANPYDARDLFHDEEKYLHVGRFDWMSRRKTSGRVLASWGGTSALLKTASGKIVRIEFAGQPPPDCGATIEAVGRPETDLFHMNLCHAIWRPCSVDTSPDPRPVRVCVRDLLLDAKNKPQIHYRHYGQPITIQGIVRSVPRPGDERGHVIVEADTFSVTVEAGGAGKAIAGLEIGSTIEATGIHVLDADTWRPQSPFPHIKGFFVVPRNDADISVLSNPPWWTPAKLAALIGALLLGISAMLVWNRSLARIAERRGRELFNAEIEKVGGDLRLEERTRLAVELHDSISQSLASVSMEMATASLYPKGADPEMTRHLAIAQRTLNSCREEIRNCIWDLRRDALGMSDMAEAIRLALLPHVKNVAMNVRFNVPRSRLTDKTAHDILQIVRELVVNAIRHGGASEVRVAGSLEGCTLKFSVSDNGCGFDPETAHGVDDGHFGLQGIRERAGRMGGRLMISSRPGGGCKATVHITLPQADRGDMA